MEISKKNKVGGLSPFLELGITLKFTETILFLVKMD